MTPYSLSCEIHRQLSSPGQRDYSAEAEVEIHQHLGWRPCSEVRHAMTDQFWQVRRMLVELVKRRISETK